MFKLSKNVNWKLKPFTKWFRKHKPSNRRWNKIKIFAPKKAKTNIYCILRVGLASRDKTTATNSVSTQPHQTRGKNFVQNKTKLVKSTKQTKFFWLFFCFCFGFCVSTFCGNKSVMLFLCMCGVLCECFIHMPTFYMFSLLSLSISFSRPFLQFVWFFIWVFAFV